MIRVTLELISQRTGEVTHLGTVTLVNDGRLSKMTNGARANYYVRLSERADPQSSWRVGHVPNFPRRRLGAYDLLFQALRDTVGKRNP